MPVQFHPGVKPNDPSKPRLKLSPFLAAPAAILPPAPEVVNWIDKVSNWPMYLNDRIGDCTFAAKGHILQALSTYARGKEIRVTDNDIQRAYTDVSGYDPATGANDNGCIIQDTLNYWRKNGVGGHKILAFAEVDISNRAEVNSALNIFGNVELGFNFPNTAMDQFNNGRPWDVVAGAYNEGGHDVVVEGYPAAHGNLRVITWGAVQEMTQAFWDRYVTEAWVSISEEWLDATGHNPEGLDLYGLGEALSKLTGGPNPFPAPVTPPEPPTPTPSPVPTPPAPLDPDIDLAAAALVWVHKRHYGASNKAMVAALNKWLNAKAV